MKISKVNHTKTAVGTNNNQETGGFLYTYPDNGTGRKDLERQITRLNNQAKILYNMFEPLQAGQAPHKPEKEKFEGKEEIFEKRLETYNVKQKNHERRVRLASWLNKNSRTITGILFKRIPDKRQPQKNIRVLCSEQEVVAKIQNAEPISLSDEEIKALVLLALRKSIKNAKLKDDEAFCVIDAAQVFLKNFGNQNITKADQETIKKFARIVKQDYERFDPKIKGSLGAKTVRSILNQNMLFQPNQDSFALSPTDIKEKKTDYKAKEKQGYETFLSIYADLNQEKRKDILCKLSRLLDLYFSAPMEDGVLCGEVIGEEYDAFEHHIAQKKEDGDFAEIPGALMESVEQHKTLDNVVKKQTIETLKDNIRIRNIACYRYAKEQVELDTHELFFENNNVNMFWIHHIENAIERVLKKINETNLYKLNRGYLKNKIWKDLLNTISIKYVAAGKAVYHFAMKDLFENNKSELELGRINQSVTGITSFDYELIKAKETLQREIAVYVQSAANNLARVTVDIAKAKEECNDEKRDYSDFLLWNQEKIEKYLLSEQPEDTYRNIFQFFGGISNWGEQVKNIERTYNVQEGKSPSHVKFLNDLKKLIFALRNESFHFTTASVNKGDWNKKVIVALFETESKCAVSLERDSFYSNNLPMFYDTNDLKKILDRLYGNQVERQSQLPSYRTIMPRNAFPEFLENMMGSNQLPFVNDDEKKLKWENACYYLCKEIYYNVFLSDGGSKELFLKAEQNLPKGEHENAVKNFQKRMDELKDLSLPEICQTIMTDFNMQNNGRKVRSSKDSLFDKEIYKHYKLLLHATLRGAFEEYINSQEEIAFIKKPKTGQAACMPAKDTFLPDWTSNRYESLVEQVNSDAQLQKWYITGKFISPRALNLLLGSMRSYIQYLEDVRNRAKKTENETYINVNEEAAKATIINAISVLEVCMKTASNVSVEFTDYFEDEDSYAQFLANYVNYGEDHTFEGLKNFCNGLTEDVESQNALYTDAKKPKLNRNMVIAKLYGPTQVLSSLVPKVEKKEIQDFYRGEKKIQSYKVKGKCKDKKEQEQLSNYQKLKNQVELRNVAEYGELINELLGQLVNWSFVRERDLLYFQLGFHYYCLQNNSEKPDAYKTIVSQDGKTIKGAILYQIAGMYINGIGIWTDKDGQGFVETEKIGSVGGKIKKFDTYAEIFKMNEDKLYQAGLEVFENTREHKSIVGIRNYIDHFKYYNDGTENRYSLLDLYSEVFDRFFTYDMKYQKNVTNMLENILAKHFYLIEPRYVSGIKKMDNGTKDRGQIEVREIESEKFTFKLSDNKAVEISARRKEELETVLGILYYPKDVPNGIGIKVPEPKEVSMQNDGGKKRKNGKSNYKKSRSTF